MQQRNKMIFDDNLEMSERKFEDQYAPKESTYGEQKLHKYESKPEFARQQPYSTGEDNQ
jgi:hypothetical protein